VNVIILISVRHVQSYQTLPLDIVKHSQPVA